MVKLVFCLRRLSHMSIEEFQRYWLDAHGPLVRSHAKTLGIKRYVQLHTLDSPANEAMRRSRHAGEPYDGIAELWWDSIEDLGAASASPAGRDAGRELLEDERKFVDRARSALWVGEEHSIVD